VPETIDNLNRSYLVQADTRFFAVRIPYNLQVSPAPAVAAFTDVPASQPCFQFVEALVASGITVGCGGGLYCVNTPITPGDGRLPQQGARAALRALRRAARSGSPG
jgi:hypothetical protein